MSQFTISREEINKIIEEIQKDSVDHFVRYFCLKRPYLTPFKKQIENLRRYYEGHVLDGLKSDDFFKINNHIFEYIKNNAKEMKRFFLKKYECADNNFEEKLTNFLDLIENLDFKSTSDNGLNDEFSKFILSLVDRKSVDRKLFKLKKHLIFADISAREKRSVKDFAKILTILVLDAYSYQDIISDQEPPIQMNIFVCKVEKSIYDYEVIYNFAHLENNEESSKSETNSQKYKLLKEKLDLNKKRNYFYSLGADLETSTFSILFKFSLSLLSIYDLYTDVSTAYQFHQQKRMYYFWDTLVIILIAGLLNIITERKISRKTNESNFTGKLKWLNNPKIYVWICFLQFSLFFRSLQILILSFNIKNSNKIEKCVDLILNSAIFCSDKEKAKINFIETCCEAIPQTILQVYIVLITNHATFIQYQSIALSFISIIVNAIGFIGSLEGFTILTVLKKMTTDPRYYVSLLLKELCFYGLRIFSTSFLFYQFSIVYVLFVVTLRFLTALTIETICTTPTDNLSLVKNLVFDHFEDMTYNLISLLEFYCYFFIYFWWMFNVDHVKSTYLSFFFYTYIIMLIFWTISIFYKCSYKMENRSKFDENESKNETSESEISNTYNWNRWKKDTIRNWCYIYQFYNLQVSDLTDFLHISYHVKNYIEEQSNYWVYSKMDNKKYKYLYDILCQFEPQDRICQDSCCGIKKSFDDGLFQKALISMVVCKPNFTITLTDDRPHIKVKIYVNDDTDSFYGVFQIISYIFTHQDTIHSCSNSSNEFKNIREILHLNTKNHFIYQDTRTKLPFNILFLIQIFFGIAPLFDMILDVYLIYKTYNDQMNIFYALLSILFTVGITNIFLERYFMGKRLNKTEHLVWILNYVKIVSILSLFQITSILQQLNVLLLSKRYTIITTTPTNNTEELEGNLEETHNSEEMNMLNLENCSSQNFNEAKELLNAIIYDNQFQQRRMLRTMKFIESCLEAVPQTVVQLYIILIHNDAEYYSSYLNIIFGLIGVATNAFFYVNMTLKKKTTWPKFSKYFLTMYAQQFCFYVSRVISFALLISQLPGLYVVLWIFFRISFTIILETMIIFGNVNDFDFIKAIFSDLTDKWYYNLFTSLEFIAGGGLAIRFLYLKDTNVWIEIVLYFFLGSCLIWLVIMCKNKLQSQYLAF